MAKRMGLSFEELSLFTMADFATFSDLWVGQDPQEPTVRKATPADIKAFFG